MHFLRSAVASGRVRGFYLRGPRACVTARYDAKTRSLVVQPSGIGVIKDGVEMAVLPDEFTVRDGHGKRIPSTFGVFAVSLSGFDPYHLVTDIPKDWKYG